MTIHITAPKKITFVHIEKNGGISFKKWCDANLKPTTFYKIVGKHASVQQIKDGFPNPGYMFTIIRNPYAREISWYHYIQKKTYQRRYRCIQRGNSPEKFDRVIAALESLTLKEYLMTQKTISTQMARLRGGVDYIIKLEQIHKQFRHIQDLTNCQEPFPLTNTSLHAKYQHYYDDELQEFIYNKHKVDFDEFGYTFN